MKVLSYIALAGCLTIPALFAPATARADIFAYTDERGVMHFTNIKGLDKRYRLVRKENGGSTGAAQRSYVSNNWMPTDADIRKYSSIVEVASREHGVDKSLVHAVISAESGYNARAISPKGASGLMQLMPDTARRMGVQSIMDPEENIHGGVKYLKFLLGMFNGNVELAVAGYNAGENAVVRAGNRIPRYPETEHYVPKVMDYYRKFQARRG